MKDSATKIERPDVSETLWPKNIPGIVKNMKDAKVSEFTISNGTCNIAELLAIFEDNGAILQGLVRVYTGHNNFYTGEPEAFIAFMRIAISEGFVSVA